MADKMGSRKYQFLIFGLCSLIALVACMAVLVITARSVEKSESSAAEYETQSKTELKGDSTELLDYLKTLTKEATDNRFIKADVYTDVSVDDSTVIVRSDDGNESETDKNLLTYAKNKMLSSVDGYYPQDLNGVFGTVYEGMPLVDLPADFIKDSRFSVGEADADGNPVYDSNTGELIDSDYYFIKLSLDCSKAAENETVRQMFSLDESGDVADRFKKDLSTVCVVDDAQVNLSELNINAKVNRLNDEIEYIDFEKIYDVVSDAAFKNELEFFGKKQISFQYRVNERFEYSYAGISFLQASVAVEPGDETVLSVNAVIEDDSEYKVTFSSSDSTVATVDEMGYVKGIKETDSPVTITVTLEYLGEKFTDECLVYVGETDILSNS